MSDEVEVLWAERAITRVLLQYARGVDALDFDLVRACFHPDARIEYGTGFAGTVDETLTWLSDALPRLQHTTHTFAPPWIELDLDAGTATCETRSINAHLYPPDPEGLATQNVTGVVYSDRFERREGSWRLIYRRNDPIWRVNVPDTDSPPPPIEAGSAPLR